MPENDGEVRRLTAEVEGLRNELKVKKHEYAKKLSYAKSMMEQLKVITIKLREEKSKGKEQSESKEEMFEQHEKILEDMHVDLAESPRPIGTT